MYTKIQTQSKQGMESIVGLVTVAWFSLKLEEKLKFANLGGPHLSTVQGAVYQINIST